MRIIEPKKPVMGFEHFQELANKLVCNIVVWQHIDSGVFCFKLFTLGDDETHFFEQVLKPASHYACKFRVYAY